MGVIRLQKFLAQSGVASRRSAETLMAEGRVSVNGAVASSLGARINDERDLVEVDGRKVRPAALLYRLLLKPRACLATFAKVTGPEGPRPTLARYVSDAKDVGWKVVAPLDFPTEGVLLLTTDGELAEGMSRGGGRVVMTYHMKYQGRVGDEEIGQLLRGWKWEKRAVKPEMAVAIATTGKNTWVELTVREMRPRALKASGEAIRRHVLKISRVKLAHLSFEGLRMGEHRDLTKAEITSLRRAAGL